jgi:hypothetical protein
MLSRSSKIVSLAETKRSASMGTTKYPSIDECTSMMITPPGNSFDNPSPPNKKQLGAMLTSLPFRYAFASDGCTQRVMDNQAYQVDQMSKAELSLIQAAAEGQNYSSSSLSGSYYTNGSESSHRINRIDCLQRVGSISSSDMDDMKSDIASATNLESGGNYVSFDNEDYQKTESEQAEDQDKFAEYASNSQENSLEMCPEGSPSRKNILEAVRSETNFSNLFNQSTLPNKLMLDDVACLKKYGVRRHHSAPQSDINWLQVRLFLQKKSLSHFYRFVIETQFIQEK